MREKISRASEVNLYDVVKRLDDRDPNVRESAATYCAIHGKQTTCVRQELINHIDDPEIAVRISLAEALYHSGERQCSLRVINQALISHDMAIRIHALQLLESFGYDVTSAKRITGA
ncbi:HEAT repeat domain-containing protein [Pseudochryseolinea flava]|uniref:HEAT repeat domain-containing protein n=1 Tax=Pseudochryseolinea flava TaxID=2059302 RepID=A0A364XYZ3_9BACT|nr:hypothetical protein [Pseudochryseolinea flava]RAV99029.1 hypothetical protein DQQ10_20760 [Pseudochryseolinea flava]